MPLSGAGEGKSEGGGRGGGGCGQIHIRFLWIRFSTQTCISNYYYPDTTLSVGVGRGLSKSRGTVFASCRKQGASK